MRITGMILPRLTGHITSAASAIRSISPFTIHRMIRSSRRMNGGDHIPQAARLHHKHTLLSPQSQPAALVAERS